MIGGRGSPDPADLREWLTNERLLRALAGDDPRREAKSLAGKVQRRLGQEYVPGAPDEQWTDDVPPLLATPRDDRLLPICRLLGEYFPRRRLIRIYNTGLDYAARDLALREGESDVRSVRLRLEEVVRYHEHSHAIVHLGAFPGEGRIQDLAHMGSTYPTDRMATWSRLGGTAHEILAQALTWQIVKNAKGPGQFLRRTFRGLMRYQPRQYVLGGEALCATREHVLDCLHVIRSSELRGLPPRTSREQAVRELLAMVRELLAM
jgi:hypothetical protein